MGGVEFAHTATQILVDLFSALTAAFMNFATIISLTSAQFREFDCGSH